MATRFYLPATGAATIGTTPSTGWNTTTGYTFHPARRVKQNSALANGTARAKVSQAGAQNRLDRIFISEPLSAQTISGTFSAVIRGLESATATDAWLQIILRVVSQDGGTQRGVLYAGSTASAVSATAGADAQEFGTTLAARIKSAVSLTSVTAQSGDRVVIEVGYRAVTANTNTATLEYGDPSATADMALSSTATSGAPWVELSQTLTFETLAKADTLTDDFLSQDNTKWTLWNAQTVVSGGELAITPTASYPGIYTAQQKDILGSHFGVELLAAPTQTTGTSSEFLVRVRVDTTDFIEISVGANGQVNCNLQINGTDNLVSTAKPSGMTHLRIRVGTDRSIIWEAYVSGAWQTIRSGLSVPAGWEAFTGIVMAGFWNAPDTGVNPVRVGSVNIYPAPSQSGALSGTGTLTATSSPAFTTTATLAGEDTLTASATPSLSRAGAVTGSGTLSAVVTSPNSGSATGTFTFTGSATGKSSPKASATGVWTFTGNATGFGAAGYTLAYRMVSAAPTLPGDAALTASDISFGAGAVFEVPSTDLIYDPNKVLQIKAATASTTIAESVTNNVYAQITVSRTGGWTPKILRIKSARGGAGTARGFAIRSSVDGYTTDLIYDDSIDTARPTLTQYTADISSLGTQTGAVTFRMYHFAPTTPNTTQHDDWEIGYVVPGGGTATGAWTFTGSASGKRTPKASTTGSWAFSGASTGKRVPKGTAAGTWSYSGSAVSKRTPKGGATGTWTFTGSTAGKRAPKAVATGTATFIGAAVGTSSRYINWEGHNWWVRNGGPAQPGMNQWGDTTANVEVLPNDDLKLTVAQVGGVWKAAEIDLNGAGLGYGRYRWTYDIDAVGMDPQVVLGLYIYDNDVAAAPHQREIDIEVTRWGTPGEPSQFFYSLHPVADGDHRQHDHPATIGPYTSEFVWQAGQCYWKTTDGNGALIGEHVVTQGVQTPGNARPSLNLWLVNGTTGPNNGQPVSATISSFEFTAGVSHSLVKAQDFSEDFSSPETWALYNGASITGGELVAPTVPAYSVAYSGSVLDMRESFTQIDTTSQPIGAGNFSQEILWALKHDDDNYIMLFASGGGVAGRLRQAGVNSQTSSVTQNATTQKFWKISHTGTTVTFQTSQNGSTWTNVGSLTTTLSSQQLSSMRMHIQAGHWAAETSPAPLKITRVGVAPATNTGTATGMVTFTGAAAGKRTPKATSAGSFTFAGAATGKRTPKGTAPGVWTFTGVATGKRTPKATAIGSWTWAGAATGTRPPSVTLYTLAYAGNTAAPTLPADGSLTATSITEGAGGILTIPLSTTASTAYEPNKVISLTNRTSTVGTEASAVSSDIYFEFTVDRTGGWTPKTLRAKIAAGGTAGPRGFMVRSSYDGYTANLMARGPETPTTAQLRPNLNQFSADLSGMGPQSGPITFRAYVYAAGNTNRGYDWDDVELDYDATAVNTASGTWTFTGNAVGKRAPKATATGTWAFTGAAVGVRPSTLVVNESGSLASFVTEVYNNRTSLSGDGAYNVPTSGQAATLAGAFGKLMTGDHAGAAADVDPLGYDVVLLSDTVTSRSHAILRERSAATRYWGLYVWSRATSKTSMVVEAPHTRADSLTHTEGQSLFDKANAKAFLMATTHRDSSASTDVDGDRVSDQANADGVVNPFQSVHVVAATAGSTVVQVHGYADASNTSYDVIVSEGKSTPSARTQNLGASIANSTGLRVAVYNGTIGAGLGATGNVQGIQSRAAGVYWVHIEQNFTVRSSATTRGQIEDVLADLVAGGVTTGSWNFTGSATGKRSPKATGPGTWTFTGTAVGKRTPKAVGSGAWTFTGTAVGGKSVPKATSAGVWTFTGTAVGKRKARASAGGTWTFTGTAVGSAPTLNNLRLGASSIGIRIGSAQPSAIYLGSTRLWP